MWRDAVTRACACALVLLLLHNTFVHCCGPGRGGTRRRSTRKLMPLIFKEHVPNVYENTLGASGLTEGPITRDSSRFQELVPNYNPDIIFRDEEGTGADRLMTERCKERLDTLAISVMNQWPGVRLRVKEAWEEDTTRHSSQSLHYEGRAVDIATSDSDRSKYGMLGRLAVEAGFDWVYYEARSHIHCSVKSESPALNRLGGCFPGDSVALTSRGPCPVSSLTEGDQVQVMDDSGRPSLSTVLMMIHASPSSSGHFLQLTTQAGITLSITPSHLMMVLVQNDRDELSKQDQHLQQHRQLFLNTSVSLVKAVFAGQVNEGDHVVVGSNSTSLELDRVVKVSGGEQQGVFAPLTAEGNIIIDGVVVSCYAVINSQTLAHWSFLPVRIYYRIKWLILDGLETFGIKFGSSGNHEDQRRLGTALPWPSKNTSNEHSLLSLTTNNRRSNGTGFVDSKEINIHWYPRLLYSLARLILPEHWIAS